MGVEIRALTPTDRRRVQTFILDRWLDATVVGHGVVYRPDELPGFVATDDGDWVGLVTYALEGDGCEVVTIDAVREGEGIGTALMETVVAAARATGCRRLWLITTNDNDRARAFYVACGLRVVAVHEGAVDRSRELKPSIPLTNERGVPIRDEIEFERVL